MSVNWSKNSDKIMSISALVTAVVALAIGYFEVRGEREFQKLSVEPYLELDNSNTNGYRLLLANSGLGPSIIKHVNTTVDGEPYGSWVEAVSRLTSVDRSEISTRYSDLWFNKRVTAGENFALVNISHERNDKELVRKLDSQIRTNRFKMEICYCSIYKDCWLTTYGENRIHEPIAQCPTYPDEPAEPAEPAE